MAKLVFINRDHAGQSYELTLEKTTVGRAGDNTLVIPDNSLSAHHCEILVNGSEVIIRDLGSRNGTIANGLKLANHQSQLKSGQTVRFGTVEARLELDEPGDAVDDTASEMTAVHAMGRALREQEQARARPKPASASKTLETPGAQPHEERTVTDLTAPQSRAFPTDPVSTPASVPAPPRSRKAVIGLVVVLVVSLAAALWFWLGRN